MEQDKIVFVKKERKLPNHQWPRVRINRETYKAIDDIANEASLNLSDVTTRLLDFALKHVEIHKKVSETNANEEGDDK